MGARRGTLVLGPGTVRGLMAWVGSSQGVAASMAVVVAIGTVATFVPMWLGLRAFRGLEP